MAFHVACPITWYPLYLFSSLSKTSISFFFFFFLSSRFYLSRLLLLQTSHCFLSVSVCFGFSFFPLKPPNLRLSARVSSHSRHRQCQDLVPPRRASSPRLSHRSHRNQGSRRRQNRPGRRSESCAAASSSSAGSPIDRR